MLDSANLMDCMSSALCSICEPQQMRKHLIDRVTSQGTFVRR